MKRFLILILSISLCIMFTLSGCSCAGDFILEFNSTQVKNIKEETLTYNVNFKDSYKEIERSSNVNADILPEYQNGLYVAKYQTNVGFPSNCASNLSHPENVINKIETKLTIDVVDTKGTDDVSDDKVYKDQIYTEVYFYDSSLSYAPIYSRTLIKNTYIANSETSIDFAPMIYQYSVTYNKSNYVMSKKTYKPYQDKNKPENNEDISGQMDLNTLDQSKLISMADDGKSYEYEFRHILDNTQLTFANRSLNLAKNQSTLIPVVSYMYSNPTKLEILNTADSTFNIESSLNYTTPTVNKDYDEGLSIPAKNIRISLYNTSYTGLPKYITVQSDSADNGTISNNGLVLEYAEAVLGTYYTTFNCLGALVYTLNNVSITYNT